jgi:hypothetical protein
MMRVLSERPANRQVSENRIFPAVRGETHEGTDL